MTHVESKGYHKEKLFFIGYWLAKEIDKFDALDIIGFEHCKEIVEMMRIEGKQIMAFDDNYRKFKGLSKEERVTIDIDSPEAMLILKLLPNRRAVYVNQHGNYKVIEQLAKIREFVMAIATPRGPKGKFFSALERIKNELHGEVHQLSNTTWITIVRRTSQ